MNKKQRSNPPGWWLPFALALPVAGVIVLAWLWKGPMLLELLGAAMKLVVIP